MHRLAGVGFAVLLSAAAGHAQSALTKNDYAEIQELLARFAHAIDSQDKETYRSIFTEDGVFVMEGMRTWTGRKELETMASGPRRERPKITHFFSNVKIEPTPEGAKASHYVLLIDLQKNPAITTGGFCDNTVVKTKEGWRFKKRVCAVEPGPASAGQTPSR